jgi:hypothetical protein
MGERLAGVDIGREVVVGKEWMWMACGRKDGMGEKS